MPTTNATSMVTSSALPWGWLLVLIFIMVGVDWKCLWFAHDDFGGLNAFRVDEPAFQNIARANPGELNEFAKSGLAETVERILVVSPADGVPLIEGELHESAVREQRGGLAEIRASQSLSAWIVGVLEHVGRAGADIHQVKTQAVTRRARQVQRLADVGSHGIKS